MSRYEDRAGLGHASALCLIAGFVDAVGYLEHGHVFTANMTGNTVLLGATAVKGDWLALSYLATIASFALGVAVSTLLKLAGVILPALFLIAGGMLVAIAAADIPGFVVLCALAFVMGIQGGAISSFSGIRLPTVVVTSTLVNLIDGLVKRGFRGATGRAAPPSNLGHLTAAWVAYGIGGAAAVLAQAHLAVPLFVPALLYAGVAVGLLRGSK
jgi:uncharacterized membrane protein YoaK (UPF0700 family)